MLSSIHPLGERGRHNNWIITVSAFTLGAALTGAALGALLGAAGSLLPWPNTTDQTLLATGIAAAAAGLLDLSRTRPPGSERQVNETWIGHYRGWVYGGAFGVQLGAGVMTYVVTWGVYATFLAEILSRAPMTGAVIGAVFGFGRSIALLAAGWIDRPSRLTAFHQSMSRLGSGVQRVSAWGTSAVGVLGGAAVLL